MEFISDKNNKINIRKDVSNERELSIRREHPFSLIQKMDEYFDNLWSRMDEYFWRPFSFRKPLSLRAIEKDPFFRTPLTNITEDKKNFFISAEVPGLEKGDLEITITDGNLEIKGEFKEQRIQEKGDLVRKEYKSSNYYRCFNLPENINEDEIDAKLDKGILKIKIPKVKTLQNKKKHIEIK